MKKSKIIIPAAAMLLFSTAAAVSGTVAWFSVNRTVTATGMKVIAKADSGLIITMKDVMPKATTNTTLVNFADSSATELYASTHDASGTYTTNLKYVTNANMISPETGLPINSSTVCQSTYADALPISTPTAKVFFKDYVVYIASSGEALTNQDVEIDLKGTFTSGNINKAMSIDYYYSSVSAAVSTANVPVGTYVDTLNVAGYDITKNDTTAKTIAKVSDVTIPAATESGTAALAIYMRVYFDGALIETKGTNTSAASVYREYDGDTDTSVAYRYAADDGLQIDSNGGYVLDTAASWFTFARTTKIADIQNVSLTSSFTAKSHTA